jgi:hypothetical protein
MRTLRTACFDRRVALLPLALWVCAAATTHCSARPVDESTASTAEALGTATLTPLSEYGVQPGWARATFTYSLSVPAITTFTGGVTCAAGSPQSVEVTSTVLSSSIVALDLRANLPWLAENGLPTPCEVTSVSIQASNGSPPLPIGSATFDNTFSMDVPVDYLTPAQLTAPIAGSSVSLQPTATSRRYLAYPPLIVAIHSANGRTAFAEVEELSARGTVGLRALASFFSFGALDRELGGGAEIYPNWGIDIDLLGVTKTTSGTEESNPGHVAYTSTAPGNPALYWGDPGGPVYPAPPVYGQDVYLANVLDNQGVPRCTDPKGCLDVVYDPNAHALDAVNGATIAWIEGGPIEAGVTAGALPAAPASTTVSPGVSPGASHAAAPAAANPAPFATRSPQLPAPAAPVPAPSGPLVSGPTPACPLSGMGSAGGTVSSVPITACAGYSTSSGCPTVTDPLPFERFPLPSPGTGQLQVSLSSMMPQYAGRKNLMDDCASHAGDQYYEYLVNKLGADVASPRTIALDGQAIVVPNPLIAYSVNGGITELENWGGTQNSLTNNPWPPLAGLHMGPPWINGYWPAYEGDWAAWTNTTLSNSNAAAALATCAKQGFWYSAFCMGQGQPPPGAYWNYDMMLATLWGNPFASMPWSLANTYFGDMIPTSLPFVNGAAAVQAVISTIGGGLPVQMNLMAYVGNVPHGGVVDSTGRAQGVLDGMTWFMPPELGGCDEATLTSAFQPTGGHAVNIIGYSVVGSLSAPDPFKSYFIIDNNWGKGAGDGGYFAMNFAAFEFLSDPSVGGGLTMMHLPCNYGSVVCTYAPPPPPPAPLPPCSAATSCPAGWNDTPPQINVSCPAPNDFYIVYPAGESTYVATGFSYTGDTSAYEGFVKACAQGTSQCVSFSTDVESPNWCYTSGGGGSSSGAHGGKGGGCVGTCF